MTLEKSVRNTGYCSILHFAAVLSSIADYYIGSFLATEWRDYGRCRGLFA